MNSSESIKDDDIPISPTTPTTPNIPSTPPDTVYTEEKDKEFNFEKEKECKQEYKEEEEAEESLSATLTKMKDDEIESLLDEIEHEYIQNEDENVLIETEDDNFIAKGIIIEELLDEIERAEHENNPNSHGDYHNTEEYKYKYSMLVTENDSLNAKKLRDMKHNTFENFLLFEKIVAINTSSDENQQQKHQKKDVYLNDSKFFYCPASADYLLHGYVRNINNGHLSSQSDFICSSSSNSNSDSILFQQMVPSIIIHLLHQYYSSPNNKYAQQMKLEIGLNWDEHKIITQHQSCNLWRWDSTSSRWKQRNALNERGQTTLLYDEIKGYHRLLHFDKKRNLLRGLQIIEANQKIENILHLKHEQKSILEFMGFDFTYIFNADLKKMTDFQSIQKWRLEFIGHNHEYYANQWYKCYNHIIESQNKNEIKMLRRINLFETKQEKEDENKNDDDEKKKEDDEPNLNNLQEYVLGLQSSDISKHIKYSRLIRRLLSNEQQPPIQEIIDCGIIQRLIYLMQYSSSPKVTFECAWALTNVASGTQSHTSTLIKFNVIPALINVFKNKNSIVEIKEQTLWALGNIAGDSVFCRDLVLKHNILKYILPLMRPYRMLMFAPTNNNNDNKKSKNKNKNDLLLMCRRQRTFMRNLVWTLSNLNRNKPLPSYNYIILSLFALNTVLKDNELVQDNELMADCCWALSYLSDFDNNFDDENNYFIDLPSILLDSDIVDILLNALNFNSSDNVKHPALRTIGNIATGSDVLTNKLLSKTGLLSAITNLLKHDHAPIKRETLWLISNITAGNAQQIDLILKNNDILCSIVNIINNDAEDNAIKKEAVWALSNATSGGTDEQVRYICNNGGIYALCKYLLLCKNKKYFGKAMIVTLEGLENMLHVGLSDALLNQQQNANVHAAFVEQFGGVDCLEEILNDNDKSKDSTDINERITNMLETYFPMRQFR